MSICVDHTIVHATQPQASADFLRALLNLPPPVQLGHFTVVRIGSTSLDFIQGAMPIASRHFAFKVSEEQFDAVMTQIVERKIGYWADPFHKQPGEINRWDDGRGVYFDDPDGHNLEVLTRSYGSGGCEAEHPNPLLGCAE